MVLLLTQWVEGSEVFLLLSRPHEHWCWLDHTITYTDFKKEMWVEEAELPRFKSQLEILEKEEQQARTEEAEAEQRLRDEQVKLDALNDLLDRYNNALEEVSRK